MAALTQQKAVRQTKYKNVALPMNFGSGMKCQVGSAMGVDTSTHYVAPMGTSSTQIPIGIALETVDLTAASAAGTVLIDLYEEVDVRWYDSVTGGNAVSTTVGGGSFFQTVYFTDDHTVSTSSSSNSLAGRVWDANSTQGVAVQNVNNTNNLLK